MGTDKAKNNWEELFRLMQENPDLPVVPMVDDRGRGGLAVHGRIRRNKT